MAKSKVKSKRKVKLKAKASGKNKAKTKRAAAKRYKVLGNGKIKIAHAGKAHNTGFKRRSRKNRLRKGVLMDPSNVPNAKRCLPNNR